jgi:hypothetical protein
MHRMKRRTQKNLEATLNQAATAEERALVCYELGLFHDNNSREAIAIPYYEKALELGLDRATEAKALAWIASSLYKTGFAADALARIEQSSSIAGAELTPFLSRLRKRVERLAGRKAVY